eukprot:3262871-Pyramimonas_sp.AAC.1
MPDGPTGSRPPRRTADPWHDAAAAVAAKGSGKDKLDCFKAELQQLLKAQVEPASSNFKATAEKLCNDAQGAF